MNTPHYVSQDFTMGRFVAIGLNAQMKAMSSGERLEIFDIVANSFCKECGYPMTNHNGRYECHCQNDE